MKKYMNVDLYSGKCVVISEEDFNEWDLENRDDFEKVVSNDGIVSFRGEEDIFIIIEE